MFNFTDFAPNGHRALLRWGSRARHLWASTWLGDMFLVNTEPFLLLVSPEFQGICSDRQEIERCWELFKYSGAPTDRNAESMSFHNFDRKIWHLIIRLEWRFVHSASQIHHGQHAFHMSTKKPRPIMSKSLWSSPQANRNVWPSTFCVFQHLFGPVELDLDQI
jgi:hypothetical protein